MFHNTKAIKPGYSTGPGYSQNLKKNSQITFPHFLKKLFVRFWNPEIFCHCLCVRSLKITQNQPGLRDIVWWIKWTRTRKTYVQLHSLLWSLEDPFGSVPVSVYPPHRVTVVKMMEGILRVLHGRKQIYKRGALNSSGWYADCDITLTRMLWQYLHPHHHLIRLM